MDPDTRRLVMFAGGLGAVLVVLIGASALIGHRSTGVPVVTADTRPIRVKPANPGGMKIDGAENDVFSGGSDTADSKLAPAAETPDAKALRTAAAAPPPVVATPAPADVAPPPPPVTRPAAVAATARRQAGSGRARQTAGGRRGSPSAHVRASGDGAARRPRLGRRGAQRVAETVEAHARSAERKAPRLLPHRARWAHVLAHPDRPVFADVAQARTFCDRVRQKGGACSVADF